MRGGERAREPARSAGHQRCGRLVEDDELRTQQERAAHGDRWRWPPESPATGRASDGSFTERESSVLTRDPVHLRLAEPAQNPHERTAAELGA